MKTRSEYRHQKYSVTFSVSGTLPVFLLVVLYSVGFILRANISNRFCYLVFRVSIDHGARARSHSSPASDLFTAHYSSVLFWPHKRHCTLTLSTSFVFFCTCSFCFIATSTSLCSYVKLGDHIRQFRLRDNLEDPQDRLLLLLQQQRSEQSELSQEYRNNGLDLD